MNLPIVFRSVAEAEFNDAAEWYEKQRAGLGGSFISEIQQVLETIANLPIRYPIASGDVRGALVRRFPYCVYYRVKVDRIVVIAVFHSARDPAVWKSRT